LDREECAMKRGFAFALVTAAISAWSVVSAAEDRGRDGEHRSQLMLAFGTMYGVDGPFLGDANAIRGVEGDEAPWVIRSAHGFLSSSGHLRIVVRGLVFADDPLVDPSLVGKNDEAEFRGLVSCLTESGSSVTTQNVPTQGFKATETGDSIIDAHVELPNPCVAPIVFVLAGSEDKWFAVTGVEVEEGEEGAESK
jgi:hypothetical protein